jgi:hypothetical protein
MSGLQTLAASTSHEMVLLFELTSDRKSVHVIDEVDEAQNTDSEPFFGADIAES